MRKHLVKRLLEWMTDLSLPGEEQVGFRVGSSMLDHSLTLMFLAGKYYLHFHGKLIVAFIDLRGAFDSISRSLLWNKLGSKGLDPHLLFLVCKLHSDNSCQVRVNNKGLLTKDISVSKGMKQGCVLAPALLIYPCQIYQTILPQLNIMLLSSVPLLLYADDIVLLSTTKSGLIQLLSAIVDFCSKSDLTINTDKSKILIFSKSWKPTSLFGLQQPTTR